MKKIDYSQPKLARGQNKRQKARIDSGPGIFLTMLKLGNQAQILLTLAASRETLRDAVFFLRIPFVTARMIIGWAFFNASTAAALSALATASSTLRIKVRIRVRRALFTSVRRAIFLTAF